MKVFFPFYLFFVLKNISLYTLHHKKKSQTNLNPKEQYVTPHNAYHN